MTSFIPNEIFDIIFRYLDFPTKYKCKILDKTSYILVKNSIRNNGYNRQYYNYIYTDDIKNIIDHYHKFNNITLSNVRQYNSFYEILEADIDISDILIIFEFDDTIYDPIDNLYRKLNSKIKHLQINCNYTIFKQPYELSMLKRFTNLESFISNVKFDIDCSLPNIKTLELSNCVYNYRLYNFNKLEKLKINCISISYDNLPNLKYLTLTGSNIWYDNILSNLKLLTKLEYLEIISQYQIRYQKDLFEYLDNTVNLKHLVLHHSGFYLPSMNNRVSIEQFDKYKERIQIELLEDLIMSYFYNYNVSYHQDGSNWLQYST